MQESDPLCSVTVQPTQIVEVSDFFSPFPCPGGEFC
jgi:hypothetical protein